MRAKLEDELKELREAAARGTTASEAARSADVNSMNDLHRKLSEAEEKVRDLENQFDSRRSDRQIRDEDPKCR